MKTKTVSLKAYRKHKKRTYALTAKYNRELLLMTLPLLIKTFVFAVIPLLWLLLAFEFYIPAGGVFGSEWVGFANFDYLIKSSVLFDMLRNAIIMNLLDIIFGTLVSIALGLLLFEIVGKIRVKIIQTVFFFPYFITWAVVGALMGTFIGDSGFITSIIEKITGNSFDFYNQPNLWYFINWFLGVWKGAGVSAVVNYAVLMGTDPEMYEAADIDGANRFQKMIYLSIPYMKNMIIVNIIMSSSNIVRYDFSRLFYATGDASTLYETMDVIETYMYRVLRDEGMYEIGTAAGLFQSVVGLGLCVVTNSITKKISRESSLF